MKFISNTTGARSHLLAIKDLLASSDQVVICSGWMKFRGLKLLEKAIKRAVGRGCAIAIYTNPTHTEPRCVEELSSWDGVFHVMPAVNYFHTKLYYGRKGDSYQAIIGSANITAAALKRGMNEELSVHVSGSVSDQNYAGLAAYLESLPKANSMNSPMPQFG